VCINDNLDPLKEKENSYVEAILQDFYESILPETSKFELPLMYRNRFLTVEELRVWMQYRHFVMCAIVVCIITLIVLTCVALNGEVAHVVKFTALKFLRYSLIVLVISGTSTTPPSVPKNPERKNLPSLRFYGRKYVPYITLYFY
jgi:hypothetical protein